MSWRKMPLQWPCWALHSPTRPIVGAIILAADNAIERTGKGERPGRALAAGQQHAVLGGEIGVERRERILQSVILPTGLDLAAASGARCGVRRFATERHP
jgi:hypothetical protein